MLAVFLVVVSILGGHAQQPPAPSAPVPTQAEPAGQTDGQQEPEQGPPDRSPVFRTGINFIRVDTIVTDSDGNHVTDLQPSDFEVYEDGVLQTVETFELVEIGAVPVAGAEPARPVYNRFDVEREAARSDVRMVVIFFDDYHVRWGSGERAAHQIVEFLQTSLLPTDLVAVMFPLTPLFDLNFTRDHQAIINQVENWVGRKYEYDARNIFENNYVHLPVETVELIRNYVSFSALQGLMIHLGGLRDARKNVLLVSEGYTYYVPPQLRGMDAQNPNDPFSNPAARDRFAGETGYEQTTQFFADAGLFQDLRRIYATANRFNTAIYSLDPRGLAVGEFDVAQPDIDIQTDQRSLRGTQDSLRMLAEETDGRAIINQNDMLPGLGQMMTDASAYYLLGYNSSLSPTDGEFHELEVRVKRDGVSVRSRPGFWAVTERDAERALEAPLNEPPRAVDVALDALAEPRRGRLVRTWVGTSRGDDGETKVTFVWEPTRGQSARLGEPDRVLVTAMGDSGGTFRGRVPEPATGASQGLAGQTGGGSGALARATFDVAPGVLQMSLAIEGQTGEVLDRDRDEIEIPDFTGPDLVLSTPAFVRARNSLEWQELVGDWDAIPTPAREFRRTERILLRFDAYAPGTAAPQVKAWLLNRAGDRLYPLVVQPAADGQPNQIDIQPAHLAPAEYVVELTATTPTDELVELVAFRIES